VKRNYQTLDNRGKVNERKLAEFLGQNRQQILPMVELITESRMAIDDLVNAMGRQPKPTQPMLKSWSLFPRFVSALGRAGVLCAGRIGYPRGQGRGACDNLTGL